MSSEFSCSYCNACPRHPCYSNEEAARCPNQDFPGMYLSFEPREVQTWLRYKAEDMNTEDRAAIEKACEVIEREIHW